MIFDCIAHHDYEMVDICPMGSQALHRPGNRNNQEFSYPGEIAEGHLKARAPQILLGGLSAGGWESSWCPAGRSSSWGAPAAKVWEMIAVVPLMAWG